MAVSKRLRYEILRRDNHACRYCGGSAPDVVLTVDHVVPVALGGSDRPDNLVTACRDCNAGKSASSPDAPLVADVAQDAVRWAKAMRQAQENAVAANEKRADLASWIDREFWHIWHRDAPGSTLPDDYLSSLMEMVDAGAIWDDLDLAGRTTGRVQRRDEWRYFCGVVWEILRNRRDEARALIESGAV